MFTYLFKFILTYFTKIIINNLLELFKGIKFEKIK